MEPELERKKRESKLDKKVTKRPSTERKKRIKAHAKKSRRESKKKVGHFRGTSKKRVIARAEKSLFQKNQKEREHMARGEETRKSKKKGSFNTGTEKGRRDAGRRLKIYAQMDYSIFLLKRRGGKKDPFQKAERNLHAF